MKWSHTNHKSSSSYLQVNSESDLHLGDVVGKEALSSTATFDSVESKAPRQLCSPKSRRTTLGIYKDKWRLGASVAALVAILTALINLSVGAWATSRMGDGNPMSKGILVEIFHGDCKKASTMNTWAHLAINVVSTCLLAGSNYCMQCLVAPTRVDIDQAHRKFKWLDIGLPSIRNLRYIEARRRWLWILLAASSLPLHLLFNSSFFSSIASMNYSSVLATPGFLQGDRFDLNSTKYVTGSYGSSAYTEQALTRLQEEVMTNRTQFERLENAACILAYANDLITNRRSVIMVTSDDSPRANGSVLSFTTGVTAMPQSYSYDWICPLPPAPYYTWQSPYYSCPEQITRGLIDPEHWTPFNVTVQYCLSQKVEEQCGFHANIAIIWTVVICNIVKVLIMVFLAYSRGLETPLLTVGDSVASFMTKPDPTTEDSGPTTIRAVKALKTKKGSDPSKIWSSDKLAGWQPSNRLRWFHAVSIPRWCFTLTYLTACLCTVGGLLGPAVAQVAESTGDKSLGALFATGLGKVRLESTLTSWNITYMGVQQAIVSSVLVANSPQLALSILYFAINTVLTSMSSASEWSHFSVRYAEKHKPKPLRTSNPVGKQRGTHFLQLPFKFAIPLGIVATLLHWLISQSIFLVAISVYNPDGTLANPFQLATCGFSPIGMIFVIICGIVMLICLLCIGLIKLDGTMPIVSSCSAAISAACHLRYPPGGGARQTYLLEAREDARLQLAQEPVVWGKLVQDEQTFQWSNEISLEERKQYSFVSGQGLGWREKVTTPLPENKNLDFL
ncbi:hypothetical protein LTR84_006833 [Exophiala bonariae]|uniref:DUF6536 domain-containing protein n=1 Tax=Exophiala bonariae TaxID=1690606 RepID=A0AAV9N177_9EURO|nr:hypothetical protein LTR84_006833 [Exophiala bonariae]